MAEHTELRVKLPISSTANSWQYTTLYDADDAPLCQLDLEDWGVTEENQSALEEQQALVVDFIVNAVNSHADLVAALEALMRLEKSIKTNVDTAHSLRGDAASEWMREDDRNMWAKLHKAFDDARTALTKAGEAE